MGELTESQLNGRFQLLDKPLALPGKCTCCGAVNRPVVDFRLDVDDYGAVVFCVDCMGAAAQVIGYVPGDKLEVARLVQLNHEHEMKKATTDVHEFHLRVAALYDLFIRRNISFSNTLAQSTERIDSEPVSESDSPSRNAQLADEQSDEPVVSERSSFLPDGSGDGDASGPVFKF